MRTNASLFSLGVSTMPIAFSCSGCANVLRVADTMAGRRGKCPQCGAINLVPPAGRIQSATPPPRSAAKTVSRKVKPVEEEVLDPEEIADGEGEEVEARPKKSKKGKKRNKRRSPALLISLIGGGVAFLFMCCGGFGGLAWWMFFSDSLGDELKYMPNNSQYIASVRVEELLKSDVFKELRRETPELDKQMTAGMNKEMGLAMEDIEQMVTGGSGPKDMIVVVRSKKALNAADLRSKNKNGTYTETKVGKYVMQESQGVGSPAFCVVDKKLLVLGDKEAVRSVLTRDKKPEFSKNMQAAMKKVDFSKTIAVAADIKSGTGKANVRPGDAMQFLGGNANMFSGMDKAEALAFQAKIGSDVRLDLTILCQDAKSAEDMKKVIDGFLVLGRSNKQMPKELNDMLDINLKVEGANVTASKSFKVGPLIQTYKQQKGKPF